jgi:sugar phosphate permease
MSLLNVLCRILSILFAAGAVVGPLLMGVFSGVVATTSAIGATSILLFAVPVTVILLLLSISLWWMGNVHDYLRDLNRP